MSRRRGPAAWVLGPPGNEPPRWGEADDEPCARCVAPRADLEIWTDDRWSVTRSEQPGALPLMLWLHPVEHVDLLDPDDEMAAEMGRVSTWLARIMSNLDHIGREHGCR